MNLDRWIDPACAERSRIAVRFARSIAGREYRPSETVSQSDWMDQSPEDARSTQVRKAHGVYVPVRVPERDGEFHLSVDARLLGPGWLGPHPPSPGRNPACDTLRSCPTGAPFGRCTQLVVVTLRTPTSKGHILASHRRRSPTSTSQPVSDNLTAGVPSDVPSRRAKNCDVVLAMMSLAPPPSRPFMAAGDRRLAGVGVPSYRQAGLRTQERQSGQIGSAN